MSIPLILKMGRERFDEKDTKNTYVEFIKDKEVNDFVTNIKDIPHAYVLNCLMDKQMQAERASLIPYKIDFSCLEIGNPLVQIVNNVL